MEKIINKEYNQIFSFILVVFFLTSLLFFIASDNFIENLKLINNSQLIKQKWLVFYLQAVYIYVVYKLGFSWIYIFYTSYVFLKNSEVVKFTEIYYMINQNHIYNATAKLLTDNQLDEKEPLLNLQVIYPEEIRKGDIRVLTKIKGIVGNTVIRRIHPRKELLGKEIILLAEDIYSIILNLSGYSLSRFGMWFIITQLIK